jgi:hypothetical protein
MDVISKSISIPRMIAVIIKGNGLPSTYTDEAFIVPQLELINEDIQLSCINRLH